MMKIVSQLRDQIETWDFCEDVKDIKGIYLDDDDDNNNEDNEEDKNKDKDNNDDKGISALGLDRDLEFSRGHQGHQDSNIKGILLMVMTTRKMTMRWRATTTRMIKLLKGISALEKDMGFSRCHQGYWHQ